MKYCLVETEDLSATGYTSPVFADFDSDAAIDKAFYNTNSNSIVIYYNDISPNTPGSSGLCKAMPSISVTDTSDEVVSYNLYTYETATWPVTNSTGLHTDSDMLFVPGQLRAADLNSDGKTDLIFTVNDEDNSTRTVVMVNGQQINDFDRISGYSDTSYAFAMDFDDNGRLDFVVVSKYSNGSTGIQPFYNNYSRDSYYVTSTAYTHHSSSYGIKPHGVFCRGIYTTLSDTKHVFVSQQLIRTSYGALEDPVAKFAIGRSNNYIEDFTLTYPSQKLNSAGDKVSLTANRNSWTPIIPNSNLLIRIESEYTSGWGIRLLINPTDSFILVGVILVLLLIIIGVVIVYIHLKEKKEDEEARNPQLDFF